MSPRPLPIDAYAVYGPIITRLEAEWLTLSGTSSSRRVTSYGALGHVPFDSATLWICLNRVCTTPQKNCPPPEPQCWWRSLLQAAASVNTEKCEHFNIGNDHYRPVWQCHWLTNHTVQHSRHVVSLRLRVACAMQRQKALGESRTLPTELTDGRSDRLVCDQLSTAELSSLWPLLCQWISRIQLQHTVTTFLLRRVSSCDVCDETKAKKLLSTVSR